MEQEIRQIINDVFHDLQEACGDGLDAETLADTIGDRMYDESEEYRAMPYAQRRALTLKIAGAYV
jgi:uncharacterized protein (UPF0335 family)